MKKSMLWSIIFTACLNTFSFAVMPSVPQGYYIEPYVTELQNVSGIAFSPGGDFGYQGQLFVLDSRPNGKIYRVPQKGNKILFATPPSGELVSLDFAPIGSPFGPKLFLCTGYEMYSLNSSGVATHFASINPFPWNLKFASNALYGNDLFHADGWEPSREAVRKWKPDGTQSVLVYTDREETVGLAFAPGNRFGNDLYVLFQRLERNGKPAAISRVTPQGLISDFVVFSEYKDTVSLAFDKTGNFGNNLFVAEYGSNSLLEIDPDGNVAQFANGFFFSRAKDHMQLASRIAFGPDGAMYVSDGGVGVVWRIARILGQLDRIEITGPDQLAENSDAQYFATAYYDGGTAIDVTHAVKWVVEPNIYADINNDGMLFSHQLHDLREDVTITAQYTNNDITLAAQKDLTIASICPSGYALQFDGQNDLVDCGILNIDQPFTLSMWLKPNDTSTASKIFSQIPSTAMGPGCLTIGANGKDDIFVYNGQTWQKIVDLSSFWGDRWHHLDVVFNADGSVTGFFDGIEQLTAVSAFNFNNVKVGLGVVYYDGLMDEVAIFNRPLSSQEIVANLNNRLTGNEQDLFLFWNFDQGQGQDVNDISGNGHNAVLGNSSDVESNDPLWVLSDAPAGFCSIEGLVDRDLAGVFDTKINILKQLDQAMADEKSVLLMLERHFKNRNFGQTNKRDVVRAKQKIFTAIQHEVQAKNSVNKSIDNLDNALNILENSTQPVQTLSLMTNPIMKDINKEQIIIRQTPANSPSKIK